MVTLYKDGMVITAERDQVPLMLKNGWSRTPEVSVEPAAAIAPVISGEEDTTDEDSSKEPNIPLGRFQS